MTIKTFQTGRQYTSHGQRIAYQITQPDSGDDPFVQISTVAFYDVDRMIGGLVNVVHFDGQPVSDKDVLDAYDAGGYKWLSDRELEYQLIRAASIL